MWSQKSRMPRPIAVPAFIPCVMFLLYGYVAYVLMYVHLYVKEKGKRVKVKAALELKRSSFHLAYETQTFIDSFLSFSQKPISDSTH